MATFKFGRQVNIHWNGFEVVGPAETVFSIPDQLYEEFEGDFRHVEPSLTWIDTNEFQTLENQVSTAVLSADLPIAITTSTTGKTISLNSGTALNGYLLVADGAGGTIWNPASTSGLTSVVGVSPISSIVSGGTVSVSLAANYQTAGTYVNAVIGTSPASVVTASGTSTVSIDQAAITAATAATNAQTVRTYVKNTTGTTIPKGSAVYVSGATGDNALISLSTASTEVGSSKTLGITAESIATDAFGYVVESGYLTGIDTSGISAGTSVWLGTTPGSLVYGAPPAEPNHSVYLGVVIREQQINGSILVKVQNGYEIDELHDVSAASPSNGDILQYKSSSNMWTKASISNAGIASSVHTHDYQTAGTYVNAVVGTSPASVSTTSGTSTVSIIASSIDSSHLANNAVVAAKIANSAVGITKIDSGSATSGQVLTANGSSGVSFTTLASAAVSTQSYSTTVNNTQPTFVNGTFSTTGASPDIDISPIAYDQVNNHIYYANDTASSSRGTIPIVKIDAATGSTIASINLTVSSTAPGQEYVYSMAFGNDRLCIMTTTTATDSAPTSRWIIMNNTLSTLASGNVYSLAHGAENNITSSTDAMVSFVKYDSNANEFVITAAYNSVTQASTKFGHVRLINATNYTTGYYIAPASITYGGSTVAVSVTGLSTGLLPSPVYEPTTGRWLMFVYSGSNSAMLVSFSQSTTTTAILSLTGRQGINRLLSTPENNAFAARMYGMILGSSGTAIYIDSGETLLGTDFHISKILVSDITSNVNSSVSGTLPIRSYLVANSSTVTRNKKFGTSLKAFSNGSDKWVSYLLSNAVGAVAFTESSLVNSSTDSTKLTVNGNFYSYACYTTTAGEDYSFEVDTNFATAVNDYNVVSLLDGGTYSSAAYIITSAYRSSDSKAKLYRVSKLGDGNVTISQIHLTSDPTTFIGITPFSQTDQTPVVGSYQSAPNGLVNLNETGTVYQISNAMRLYLTGSSLSANITASVSTTATNTTTYNIMRIR